MSIGKEFMLKTQYPHMGETDQKRGLPPPPLELSVDPSLPCIDLPHPAALTLPPVILRDLIEQRTTVRKYSPEPLTLAELSYLLWCTQGVKWSSPPDATRRTVPSAGARHPFETYLLVNRVDGLTPGLYRFLATQHKLIALNLESDITQEVMKACLGQQQVGKCAVMFLWVAVVERCVYRYGERGYRYMHLDAGHVCQNLYLAAEMIGGGVCALAAYDDDSLNSVLGLDGETLFVIYAGTVGKK